MNMLFFTIFVGVANAAVVALTNSTATSRTTPGTKLSTSNTAQSIESLVSVTTHNTDSSFSSTAHNINSSISSTTHSTGSSTSSLDATITAAPSSCNSYEQVCSRSGDPYYDNESGLFNAWYDAWYLDVLSGASKLSLFTYCTSVWLDQFDAWAATAAVTSAFFPTTTLTTLAVIQSEIATITSTYTSYWSVSFASEFSYSAAEPCCGYCEIFGNNVRVFYWPTSTNSSVSTLVNDAGFTFVSPSVYLAFDTLSATDWCGPVGQPTTATLSFDQSDLSTATAWHYDISQTTTTPWFDPNWKSADWESVKTCSNETVSFWQDHLYGFTNLTVFDEYAGNPSWVWYTATYNPCSPTISLPRQVWSIDPLWNMCIENIDGLSDPPYGLSTGNGLAAFSATTSPSSFTALQKQTTTSTPAARQTITPTIATRTTAAIVSTAYISSSDPPASSLSPIPIDPTQTASTSPTTVVSNEELETSKQGDTPASSPATSNNLSVSSQQTEAPPTSSVLDPVALFSLVTNSQSNVIIASQTLTPGGQLTNSGTTYSLASNGGTLAIADSNGIHTQTNLDQLQRTITADPTYIIGSQTLAPGGSAITISGNPISLVQDGSSIVVGSSTQALSALISEATHHTTAPAYIAAGKTLAAGSSAIEVSGALVSLDASGKSVVVAGPSGTRTLALSQYLGPSTTIATTAQGLGAVIESLGGFVVESGTSTSGVMAQATTPAVNGTSSNGTMFLGGGAMSLPHPGYRLVIGLSIATQILFLCTK